jgi:hypothetical protein
MDSIKYFSHLKDSSVTTGQNMCMQTFLWINCRWVWFQNNWQAVQQWNQTEMSFTVISIRNGASSQVQYLKLYNVPRQNLVKKTWDGDRSRNRPGELAYSAPGVRILPSISWNSSELHTDSTQQTLDGRTDTQQFLLVSVPVEMRRYLPPFICISVRF